MRGPISILSLAVADLGAKFLVTRTHSVNCRELRPSPGSTVFRVFLTAQLASVSLRPGKGVCKTEECQLPTSPHHLDHRIHLRLWHHTSTYLLESRQSPTSQAAHHAIQLLASATPPRPHSTPFGPTKFANPAKPQVLSPYKFTAPPKHPNLPFAFAHSEVPAESSRGLHFP